MRYRRHSVLGVTSGVSAEVWRIRLPAETSPAAVEAVCFAVSEAFAAQSRTASTACTGCFT